MKNKMVRFMFHLSLLVCVYFTAVNSGYDCDVTLCPTQNPYCTSAGCVTKCPENSFASGTRCVLNCGDGVVDGNICRDVCPADKNLTVEKIIVVGTSFEQVRFCVDSCDFYSFAYKNTCVSECPAEAMFVVKMECKPNCPDDLHLQIEKKTRTNYTYVECTHVCNLESPVLKNQTCVNKCDDGEVVFERSCIEECPDGFEYLQRSIKWEIKDKVCVKDCGDEFYFGKDCVPYCPADMLTANKSCVQSCPTSTPFTLYKHEGYYWENNGFFRTQYHQQYSVNLCVAECPINMLYDNNTCTLTCPAQKFNRTCIKKCPQSFSFSSNNTCLHQCPDSTFAINFTCVLSCPHVSYNNECVSSCPSATFLENTKCVDECQPNMYYCGDECVSRCPNEDYVFNRTCVKNCPPSFLLLENRNCVSKCQSYMYYSGKECVSKCPNEGYVFNRTCVKNCPPSILLSENRNCVSECQPNMYYSGEECVSRCPKGKDFIYNKTCLSVCPSEAPIMYDSCKIETCYRYGNTYHPIMCVQKCPKSFAFNLTCVKQCPKMVNDNQCVEECPKNKPYIDKHSYPSYNDCVNKCSDDQVANGGVCIYEYDCERPIVSDGKCLDICPDGMYWVGSSKRRGSCESVWFYYGFIIVPFILIAILFPMCIKFFRFQPFTCASTLCGYGTKIIGRRSRQSDGYQPVLEEDSTAGAEGINLVV